MLLTFKGLNSSKDKVFIAYDRDEKETEKEFAARIQALTENSDLSITANINETTFSYIEKDEDFLKFYNVSFDFSIDTLSLDSSFDQNQENIAMLLEGINNVICNISASDAASPPFLSLLATELQRLKNEPKAPPTESTATPAPEPTPALDLTLQKPFVENCAMLELKDSPEMTKTCKEASHTIEKNNTNNNTEKYILPFFAHMIFNLPPRHATPDGNNATSARNVTSYRF